MKKEEKIRLFIEIILKDLLHAAKKHNYDVFEFYGRELSGVLQYMHFVDDISEEVFERVFKLKKNYV